MENVERTQFVVLTGHLDDRPLPDLIRTLRAQRKSGRLQVEYADSPGAFFFEDGQLVDAQMGNLRGVEALYAALALPGASFNFNPLVRPPERSIDRQGQKFVQDLIEVPRRENLPELRLAGSAERAPAPALPANAAAHALPPAPQNALVRLEPSAAMELTAPLEARLSAVESAIAHTSRRFSRERMIYAVVISFLVGLTGITALQAIFDLRRHAQAMQTAQLTTKPEMASATNNSSTSTIGGASTTNAAGADAKQVASAPQTTKQEQLAKQEQTTAAPIETPREVSLKAATLKKAARVARQSPTSAFVAASSHETDNANADSTAASGGYVVNVLMEVKEGRVTGARVLNPRAGASAYEALALRMARQRRYPDNFTGGDTWKIKVKP